MDEEELQKRFTDCVYFLASPLTCKKGIECEYRHSEIARLNPRDCWYWLGGCCFNPDCAFRHPPLEGLKEAYLESSNLNNAPALPVEKTNIPCYFYSKGFCNKGEHCSFLHGSADVSLALKPSQPTSMVNNPAPCVEKLFTESNTRSTPVNIHPTPSEPPKDDHTNNVRTPTQDPNPKQERNTPDSQQERSESPDMSNSLDLLEEFVQSGSDVFNDQSSGFDVVVEGESERYEYEQDVEYFSVHEEEEGEEEPIEYDQTYPELGNGIVKERCDVYECLDKGESRKSIFYRLSFKKRNLQSEAPLFNGRKGHDLREHLKKRKDGFPFPYCFSQGYDRNFRRYPQRKAIPMNRYRKPQLMQQKRRFKEKDTIFTGPKTLDEIKEQKKNTLQRKDDFQGSRHLNERKYGFQGPRPFSEILKNKRKFG
ncbi:zinc finger CCCH domain-containing protein 17 [Lactuca sativa]|uniref:C3H1-type domain-containing protein n=1 Tax=Lactuca sativa TaxID=4236 RepID=A0A9R1UWG5_LACSA|nr:zinc finger CCCH domain-containing protein 17 [Lactuca sativa]XP_052621906.1 zinc finger CCCH domain-containing protein 17 [Lactuca sativa]KAJ0195061.1 hypothetical protein LSAT_V11C700359690 [Lactuca sativa]